MKTQNGTRQSNDTVNSTTSHTLHPPPRFLLLNMLNKEFSTTDYCVTLYKDISIASPWGAWVLSRYWDWKTWIWSQSSPRTAVLNPRLSTRLLPLINSQLIAGRCVSISQSICVYRPRKKQTYTEVIYKICFHAFLWFVILLWSLRCSVSIEIILGSFTVRLPSTYEWQSWCCFREVTGNKSALESCRFLNFVSAY